MKGISKSSHVDLHPLYVIQIKGKRYRLYMYISIFILDDGIVELDEFYRNAPRLIKIHLMDNCKQVTN